MSFICLLRSNRLFLLAVIFMSLKWGRHHPRTWSLNTTAQLCISNQVFHLSVYTPSFVIQWHELLYLAFRIIDYSLSKRALVVHAFAWFAVISLLILFYWSCLLHHHWSAPHKYMTVSSSSSPSCNSICLFADLLECFPFFPTYVCE